MSYSAQSSNKTCSDSVSLGLNFDSGTQVESVSRFKLLILEKSHDKVGTKFFL
jgi:hypothetical protein